MPSNHLILCHPLLLLPSIFPSIRVFSNESVLCIRWPKYWSFSFQISPTNEHPGLISFRMDWLDLLAVQGTLKSLLQHDGLLNPFHDKRLSSVCSFRTCVSLLSNVRALELWFCQSYWQLGPLHLEGCSFPDSEIGHGTFFIVLPFPIAAWGLATTAGGP